MDLSPAAALAAPLTALIDSPLALLVDGENIPKPRAPDLLPVARVCGDARIRRVYGGLQHISGWEDHGFRLCPTRPGKNSADMLLCVEAMLLALREGIGTIAIVTGDRDFSYLAEQLREIGVRVIGIGDRRTPASFRNACSCFYQLDPTPALPEKPVATEAKHPPTKLIPLVRKALTEAHAEDGWSTANWIRSRLKKADPGFSHTLYGSGSLETILKGLRYFQMRQPEGKAVQFRDPHPLKSGAPVSRAGPEAAQPPAP